MTETIDRLFLELSLVTNATTGKEEKALAAMRMALEYIQGEENGPRKKRRVMSLLASAMDSIDPANKYQLPEALKSKKTN